MIPGDDLQLPESDLLQNIGKYLALYEHEQRKRMILAQAYNQLMADFDALKNPQTFGPDDVVIGQP